MDTCMYQQLFCIFLRGNKHCEYNNNMCKICYLTHLTVKCHSGFKPRCSHNDMLMT